MKTRTITYAAIAAACLAGTSAYAGPKPVSKPVVQAAQESCITGDIGVDAVSNYIRNGIVMENQGIIIQPYLDLHFRLYKGTGFVDSITADLGLWNSFQSPRGAVSTTARWFESDVKAGFTFNMDKLALGTYYKVYSSPGDRFRTAQVAGLSLSYDDSDLLGDFALHPYAFAEFNFLGSTGNSLPAVNAPGQNGQYYEVGITPAHTYGNLTLSLPIKGGFGSGGFYLGNRGFGFVSVGLDASYALDFVPECLGKWSAHAGASWVRLGGNNSALTPSGASGAALAFGAPPNGGAPVSNSNQFVFGGGLRVAF